MATIGFILSHTTHQNATFKLAKELTRCNHKVVYAGPPMGIDGDNLKTNAKRQGFHFEKLTLYKTGEKSVAIFEQYVAGLLSGLPFKKLIQRINPDLIILDIHFPVYAIIFSYFKIPVVFISTELLTDEDELVPPLTSSSLPSQLTRQEIKKEWAYYYSKRKFPPSFHRFLIRLGKLYNFPLKKLFNPKRCIVPFGLDLPELIVWPKEFDFPRARKLNNKYYIGAWTDINRKEKKISLKKLRKDRKMVYCALGSRSKSNKAVKSRFLKKIIELFAKGQRYELIVSITEDFESLRRIKKTNNIHLVKNVPQIQVLSRCDLMITHAGGNSVKECITLGVPMLCFPSDNDQFGNAARVVNNCIGLVGDMASESTEQIEAKIERLLHEDIFLVNVRKFRKLMLASQTDGRSVGLIESFFKN